MWILLKLVFFHCVPPPLCIMNLLCVPSLVRLYTRKTVTQSAPVIPQKVWSVKSTPALKAPNAWSRKENEHATTQARQITIYLYCQTLTINLLNMPIHIQLILNFPLFILHRSLQRC